MVLTVESVIPILEENVGPIVVDPLPRESTTPEVEVDIPFASLEMIAPAVMTDEPSLPAVDSPLEPAQPSPLLAIT